MLGCCDIFRFDFHGQTLIIFRLEKTPILQAKSRTLKEFDHGSKSNLNPLEQIFKIALLVPKTGILGPILFNLLIFY